MRTFKINKINTPLEFRIQHVQNKLNNSLAILEILKDVAHNKPEEFNKNKVIEMQRAIAVYTLQLEKLKFNQLLNIEE